MWAHRMYHFSTPEASSNNSKYALHTATFFNDRTPALIKPSQDSWERPVEDMVIYQALTSGSGIWENTEDKPWNSSTAPQPRSKSWGGLTGWTQAILSPSFSLQSPCPLSPSSSASSSFPLSACLPACTGAVHRTGPQWPWVINGHYRTDAFPPFTFVCRSVSLSCPSPTTQQEPKRHTGGHHCRQLNTASLQQSEQPCC